MARATRKRTEASDTAGHSGKSHPAVSLGELPTLLGFVLRQAQLTLFRSFLTTFEELDLRPTQFGILMVIKANPGLTQSDLSDALSIKRANLVAMLDTLENRDLIQRRPMPHDRRSRLLYLTDQGQDFVGRMLTLHGELEGKVETALGPEGKRELLKSLNALIGVLGGDQKDAPAEEDE